MADRVQVRDLQSAPEVRPQARPVDTFVTPAVARPADSNPFLDLAGALDTVNPSLQRFLGQKNEELTEEEIAEGKRAYAENRQKFKQAVEQNLIPAGASPHFKRGYKQAELRNLGFSYDQRLREAYTESGVANSDDPEAVNQFMAEFRANYLKENVGDAYDDIDVSEAFLPQIERSHSVLAQRHVEQRIKSIEQGYRQEFEQETFNSLDAFAAQPEGFDPTQASMVLQGRLDEVIASGMSKQQANQTLVEAITNKAIDAGDPEMLDVLDLIQAGPGGKLGSTKFARAKREAAEDAITSDAMRQERYNHWKLDQRRTEVSRTVTSQAFDKIISNPGANIDAELQQLRKVDPGAAASLLSFQQSKLSADTRIEENPSIIAGLYQQLDDPTANHAAIISEYAAARMINASSAKAAHSYARQTRDFNEPLSDRTFTSAMTDLESIVSGGDNFATSTSRFIAQQAKRELRTRYVSWLEENKEAPSYKKAEFLDQQIEKLSRNPRFSGAAARDINADAAPTDIGPQRQPQPQPQQTPQAGATTGPSSPADAPQPPEAAVLYLRENPGSWEQFEQKFGAGSSIPYLKPPEWPPMDQ